MCSRIYNKEKLFTLFYSFFYYKYSKFYMLKIIHLDLRSVYIGIRGTHLESFNHRGAINISRSDKEIVHDDVVAVLEAAKAVQLSFSDTRRANTQLVPRILAKRGCRFEVKSSQAKSIAANSRSSEFS